MEWDTAAGHAILNYAGGTIIDLETKKNLFMEKRILKMEIYRFENQRT